MSDPRVDFKEFLHRQLKQSNLDLIEAVAVPKHGDRLVRMRTLQEMLEEFDNREDSDGSVSYIIQLKPSRNSPALPLAGLEKEIKPQLDGIYLPNGKLNSAYLAQNADLLFASGDYALARKIYRTILQSGENSATALFGIAKTYDAEGKTEDARKHFEESIAYHPTLEAYRRLASTLIQLKNDLQAAEILERALNLKDISPAIRLEMHKTCAHSFARAKKTKEAERHYQRALAINPGADEVRTSLGMLYLMAGKTPEARKHFQDAIAANPSSDKALTGVASCFLAEGDKRLAHDYFAKALDVQINNPNAIFHLVKCAYELKSYATAARLLESYVEIAPINVNLLYSLAGLQYHLGRMIEARQTTQRILQLQPTHAGAAELTNLIEKFSGGSSPVGIQANF